MITPILRSKQIQTISLPELLYAFPQLHMRHRRIPKTTLKRCFKKKLKSPRLWSNSEILLKTSRVLKREFKRNENEKYSRDSRPRKQQQTVATINLLAGIRESFCFWGKNAHRVWVLHVCVSFFRSVSQRLSFCCSRLNERSVHETRYLLESMQTCLQVSNLLWWQLSWEADQ